MAENIIKEHIGLVIRQLREQGADWKLRKSHEGRFVIRRLRKTE